MFSGYLVGQSAWKLSCYGDIGHPVNMKALDNSIINHAIYTILEWTTMMNGPGPERVWMNECEINIYLIRS